MLRVGFRFVGFRAHGLGLFHVGFSVLMFMGL